MMAASKECLLNAQLWYRCVHDCTQECLLVSGCSIRYVNDCTQECMLVSGYDTGVCLIVRSKFIVSG